MDNIFYYFFVYYLVFRLLLNIILKFKYYSKQIFLSWINMRFVRVTIFYADLTILRYAPFINGINANKVKWFPFYCRKSYFYFYKYKNKYINENEHADPQHHESIFFLKK